MNRLLLSLAVLLLLGGCDLIGSSDGPRVVISSVTFESFPTTKAGNRSWDDDGSGPDIYFEIQNALGRAYLKSEVRNDADATTSTAPFVFSEPTVIRDMNRYYYINVVDMDPGTSKGLETIAITTDQTFDPPPTVDFATLSSEGVPGEIRFQSTDGKLVAKLAVHWYPN